MRHGQTHRQTRVTSIHFASSTITRNVTSRTVLRLGRHVGRTVYSGCAERLPVVRCVGSGSQLGGQWTMDVRGEAVNRVTRSIIARPTMKCRGCMAVKCRPSNITGAGCRQSPARDVSSSVNIIRSLYPPCGRRSCRLCLGAVAGLGVSGRPGSVHTMRGNS